MRKGVNKNRMYIRDRLLSYLHCFVVMNHDYIAYQLLKYRIDSVSNLR